MVPRLQKAKKEKGLMDLSNLEGWYALSWLVGVGVLVVLVLLLLVDLVILKYRRWRGASRSKRPLER
jgi:flagellar biosynthesis/type III secretory pathway M-ring protein FliF/YscJ